MTYKLKYSFPPYNPDNKEFMAKVKEAHYELRFGYESFNRQIHILGKDFYTECGYRIIHDPVEYQMGSQCIKRIDYYLDISLYTPKLTGIYSTKASLKIRVGAILFDMDKEDLETYYKAIDLIYRNIRTTLDAVEAYNNVFEKAERELKAFDGDHILVSYSVVSTNTYLGVISKEALTELNEDLERTGDDLRLYDEEVIKTALLEGFYFEGIDTDIQDQDYEEMEIVIEQTNKPLTI